MNTVLERIRRGIERFRMRLSQQAEHEPRSMVSNLPATMSGLETPEEDVLVAEELAILLPARVILYNDEVHTFDEVILQLVRATGCTSSQAESLAAEVDQRGLANVFEGEMDRCLRVSSILEEIALHTSIEMS